MRKITREEGERWQALAREHGFVNASGDFLLGRFVTETDAHGSLVIRVITPIPASLYTEDLERKTPPIMFDRTPSGEILLPGRLWQSMFECLSEDPAAPSEVRAAATRLAHSIDASDAHLPAATDTISILAPDADGKPVSTEALPPEGIIRLDLDIQEERMVPADPTQWPWYERLSDAIGEAIDKGCADLQQIAQAQGQIPEEAVNQVFQEAVGTIVAAMPDYSQDLPLETVHAWIVAMQQPLHMLFMREAQWLERSR
jgi:hypothetical protein